MRVRRNVPGTVGLPPMPFTLRNLKADLEDVGSNFDGAPDLEFRLATDALELEKSGLSYQSVPPTNRWRAGATRAGAWRGTAGVWTPLRVRGIERFSTTCRPDDPRQALLRAR